MSFIKDNFEAVLTEFFKAYKPKQIDKVPEFLEEFKGQEDFCIQSLCKRYFVDYNRFIKRFDGKIEALPEKERIVLDKFQEPKTKVLEGEEASEEESFEEEVVEEKKKSKLPLIIVIIIVILGTGAGAFFMMGGDGNDSIDNTEMPSDSPSTTDDPNLKKVDFVDETQEESTSNTSEEDHESVEESTEEVTDFEEVNSNEETEDDSDSDESEE